MEAGYEALISEARARFEEVYRSMLGELEAEARRIVEEKLRRLEGLREEIKAALRV